MPARSKSQQRLFGMVHAYQKGKLKNAPEEVKNIARSISDEDAEHFAKTKHKGLPEKKAQAFSPDGLLKWASRPTKEGIQKLIRTFVRQTRSKPIPFSKANGKVRKGLLVRGSSRFPSEEFIPEVAEFERRYDPIRRAYFVSANPLLSEPYASTVNGFLSYGNPKKVPFITKGNSRFGPITDGTVTSHIWGNPSEAAKLNASVLQNTESGLKHLHHFNSAEAVAPRMEWANAASASNGRVFKSVGTSDGIGLDYVIGKDRAGLPDIRSGVRQYPGSDVQRALYRDVTAENALIRLANTYPEYRDMIYSAIRKYDKRTFRRLMEQTRPDKITFGIGENMINYDALFAGNGRDVKFGIGKRWARMKKKFPEAMSGPVSKKKSGVDTILRGLPDWERELFIQKYPQYRIPPFVS